MSLKYAKAVAHCLFLCLWMLSLIAMPASANPSTKAEFDQFFKDQSTKLQESIVTEGDLEAATTRLNELWLFAAKYAPEDVTDGLRALVQTESMIKLLSSEEDPTKRKVYADFLIENPTVLDQFALLYDRTKSAPAGIMAQLQSIHSTHPELFKTHPNLVAAVAATRHQPPDLMVDGKKIPVATTEEILDFYVEHEKRMVYGIKNLPVQLLVYVVDVVAPLEDMRWALKNYRGKADVGRRYHELRFDYKHIEDGVPKKVSALGPHLPNIQKSGGLAEEMAYFSATVGKSIGVPSAIMLPTTNDGGHTWVAYLANAKGNLVWDHDTGRFQDYLTLRGETYNLSTGETESENALSFSALGAKIPLDQRLQGLARTRIMAAMADWMITPEQELGEWASLDVKEVRAMDMKEFMTLAMDTAKMNPGQAELWKSFGELAGQENMSDKQREQWIRMGTEVIGTAAPDNIALKLQSTINSMPEAKDRSKQWEQLIKRFRRQPSLAADARLLQAQMWEDAGNLANAGKCYVDIIERYPNNGDAVLTALEKTESMLLDANQTKAMLKFYSNCWRKTSKPRKMFARLQGASNWVKIGQMYSNALLSANQERQAENIDEKIKEFLEISRN